MQTIGETLKTTANKIIKDGYIDDKAEEYMGSTALQTVYPTFESFLYASWLYDSNRVN